MKKKKSLQTYFRLLSYLKSYWIIFIVATISNIAYSGMDAYVIHLLKPLVDDGFVNKDPGVIKIIPYLLPLIFLSRGVFSFASTFGMMYIARKIVMKLRLQLFSHYLQLPIKFFDQNSSGNLLSKIIFNVDQVSKAATDVITDITRDIFLIAFLIYVMFSVSVSLTLTFLVAMPIISFLFVFISKRFKKLSHRMQNTMGTVSEVAEEGISANREIRIFGGCSFEVNRFYHALKDFNKQEMKSVFMRSISGPVIQLLAGCALALTIFSALSLTGKDAITAGGFTALFSSMVALLKPLKELNTINSAVQKGVAGAESIFDILDMPKEPNFGTKKITKLLGRIEYKQVSFKYNDEKEVLKNVSFTANPGETIAFVGKSGAGKTSIINLLPRFYNVNSGEILLDDINIQDYELSSLRDNIAIVSQDITLFNSSILDNITYGVVDYKLEDVINAARFANLEGFIETLPKGINTIVGEDGVLLSGGQRQRIAIARAIFKNAQILILDEATSALDSETEVSIQKALDKLMLNRTTFVIAHRLSTIVKADKIIVLDQGMIIESGKHSNLLEKAGIYKSLYKMQYEQNFEMEAL
tara:strand:+ start:15752 stop:17506 length:1755 start_codon:yes stop_codon:yes gene_type:complete